MVKNTSKRGFTLIELLVVIAIIGILASVVLASLNSARQKGADASIKSNLNNARAQAELYYDGRTPNSYHVSASENVCSSTSGIANMITGARNANGTAANVVCGSEAGYWAAKALLVSNTAHWYCVDSSGQAKTYTSTAWTSGAVTACPAGS